MDLKQIKDYINKNSTTQTRTRSKEYKPKLIEIKGENIYHFQCNKYTVKIDLSTKNIKSECTCPYDYEGICKHKIATLNSIITTEIKKTVQNIEGKKLDNSMFIKLDNGLLTMKVINSLQGHKTLDPFERMYIAVKITEYETNKISGYFSTFGNHDQNQIKIEYNQESDSIEIIHLNKKIRKILDTDILFLEKIQRIYGENVFKYDYLDEKIITFVKTNNISIEQATEYFDFSVNEEGFLVKEKYKNLVFSPKKYGLEMIDDPELYVPKAEQKIELGLSLVIQGNKSSITNLFFSTGKWNKNHTDFSSKIEAITSNESLNYYVDKISEQEYDVLVKYYKSFSYLKKENDLKGYKSFWDLFYYSVVNLPSQIFYFINKKDNLVRKNCTPFSLNTTEKLYLYFIVTKQEKVYNFQAKIRFKNISYNLSSNKINLMFCFFKFENEFYLIDDFRTSFYINRFIKNDTYNITLDNFEHFEQNLIKPLSKFFEIEYKQFKTEKQKKTKETKETTQNNQIIENEEIKQYNQEKQVYISESEEGFIQFKLIVQYENKHLINVFSQEKIQWIENNQIKSIERNEDLEEDFIDFFRTLHQDFQEQDYIFFLNHEELIENNWFIKTIEKIKNHDVKIFGANDLKSFKYNIHKPKFSYSINNDSDWFDLKIDISFDKQKVNLRDLQKAIIRKSNYVELSDGTLGILPQEWIQKFENYFKTSDVTKDNLKISKFQFGIIDDLYNQLNSDNPLLLEMMQKKERLNNLHLNQNIQVPKGIKAKLRDYQINGLNWLVFLDENKLGGCLADDMGLGKTLQTITFLQHLKITKKSKKQNLIVAPTSLIFNWNKEIEKFCPTMKILTFTGLNRHKDKENFNKYDLIITTYGTILNDIEFLKNIDFNYIILDESQAIKNPTSKRYKACRLLQAENRLALTGTPIENNTFDLYAQMNFINPGLLGSMNHFKKEFAEPIDRDKNKEVSNLLSKMVSPFMLRRTKKQVATELPEKTESIIYCEMEPQQRKIYEAYKDKFREQLLNKIDSEGIEKAQMHILEGLTKLRQICNSTSLIKSEEDYGEHSIKLDILMENIIQKTGNHKILVFSQFVQMLQIIKTRFEQENIQYEYLDGQTQNRQEKVDNFQNNEKIRVFLISLKAGGTGLNLTEADYVFLVDPWWNPAVENQAIDRCYRIGQTRHVMAYRMICRDTIEEKISKLQQGKRSVSESIIQVDEVSKKIDAQEVKNLFS